MSVCLLVLALVWDQVQYDRFHPERDRIVRVLSQEVNPEGGAGSMRAAAPAPLAPAMEDEIPSVQQTTRIGQIRALVYTDREGISADGLYAEPSFFDLFGFELKEGGDPRVALRKPGQILLKEELAEKLFGDGPAIGKTVTIEDHTTFTVAGIVAEPPGKTHLAFDMLASFRTLKDLPRGSQVEDWRNTWTFATYARIDDGASIANIESLLAGIADRQYAGQQTRIDFSIQRLGDIALGPQLSNEIASYSLSGSVVYVLAGLALLVMLAAGFNYVSLSVARAMSRSQEIGVRKTTGAGSGQIVMQLMTEAVLLALMSLGLGYVLLAWLLPAFNRLRPLQMLGASVSPSHLFDPALVSMFVGFALLTGLLAGLYPALRLSRVQPAQILAASPGGAAGGSSARLRTALASGQFALALVFVSVAALLAGQVDFMVDAEYGFETQNRLVVDIDGRSIETLRSELAQAPAVDAVTMTSSHPVSGSRMGAQIERESADPVNVTTYAIDRSFPDVMGLELAAGRSYPDHRGTDSTSAVLVNEQTIARLGYATPAAAVGQTIRFEGALHEVIGVVRDYHYDFMTSPIGPLVLYTGPSRLSQAIVHARPGQMQAAASQVEAIWSDLKPLHEATVTPLAEKVYENPMHRAMRDASSIVGVVSLLAILISSLGLFGTAVHTVERRRKEVGVRKALGATQKALVWLLTRRYVVLVAGTSLIALPIAWLVNRTWMQVFAYRVPVSPWLLGACALGLGTVALAVVATQTYRAAGTDPSVVLRTE
jgi:putative ABC transport system permease protein